MVEVEVTIRFLTPCLGWERGGERDTFPRRGDGGVLFLPSQWRALMRFAAQVLNRHHGVAEKVEWTPRVSGETTTHRRYYADSRYRRHEAFAAGEVVGTTALLPPGLDEAGLRELLAAAGAYRGFNPGKHENFGRFEPVAVSRRKRRPETQGAEEETTVKT